MKRKILKELIDWKESKNRKPLILNGARQVGKTYILKEFGKLYYQNVAYVNCDNNQTVNDIFSLGFNIKRIILSLSALTDIHITPGKTLIILDEIQENPLALNSLKYFCENAPEYHIAVAGSLLGVSLHSGVSFPVGKVDMLKMYPLTFEEFLAAIGEDFLLEILKSKDFKTIDSVADKF